MVKRTRKPAPPDLPADELRKDLLSFRDLATFNDPRYISKAFSTSTGGAFSSGAFQLHRSELAHAHACSAEDSERVIPVSKPGDSKSRKATAAQSEVVSPGGKCEISRPMSSGGKRHISKAERKRAKKEREIGSSHTAS